MIIGLTNNFKTLTESLKRSALSVLVCTSNVPRPQIIGACHAPLGGAPRRSVICRVTAILYPPRQAAIAAKSTKRLKMGSAMAQKIFTIRLPLINGALAECCENRTEPIATNARLARSGHEFRS